MLTCGIGYSSSHAWRGMRRPAIVQSVTRIETIGAPAPDDLLGNLLFALKHEGINLAILAQALPQIPAAALEAELKRTRM